MNWLYWRPLGRLGREKDDLAAAQSYWQNKTCGGFWIEQFCKILHQKLLWDFGSKNMWDFGSKTVVGFWIKNFCGIWFKNAWALGAENKAF